MQDIWKCKLYRDKNWGFLNLLILFLILFGGKGRAKGWKKGKLLRKFCPLIRHYFGHFPEKKGLCSFIISALSRLTYLLLHRLLLSTFLLTPSYFPPYSFLLTPSLLPPSLLITSSLLLLSLLLPSLLLTTSLLTTPLLITSLLTPSPLFLQTYPPAIATVGRWLAVRCLAQ